MLSGIRFVVFMGVIFVLLAALLSQLTYITGSGSRWFLIAFLCILFCVYITPNKINKYSLWMSVIFIAALVLRFIFAVKWSIEPISDFKRTYDAASTLIPYPIKDWNEIIVASNTGYRTTFSMIMPYVLFEALVLKFFGGGIFTLKMVNVIAGACTCVLTASIAQKIFNRRAGIIAGLLMALNPVCLFFTPVLSNQHTETFFFVASLFFFINKPFKHNYINIIISSLLLLIAQLLRSEMYIVLMAVLCYAIWKILLNIKNHTAPIFKYSAQITAQLTTFLCVFFIGLFCISGILVHYKVIETPLTNSTFTYKIAVGLNQKTMGTFDRNDSAFINDEAALKALIKERVKDPSALADLFFKKLVYQFGTYNYTWSITGKTDYVSKNIYPYLTSGYMFIILLFSCLSVFWSIRKHKNSFIFIMIILLGYIIAFSIIEIQDRYNYFLIPIFAILSSMSACYFPQSLTKWMQKERKDAE